MKAIGFSLRIAAALAAFAQFGLVSPAAADQKSAPQAADLQVLIDVPPTWRPFLEDDIADALASRLMNTFQRRGYAGKIEQIAATDTPATGTPRLEIRLIEWRIGRTGNADCTLGATLKTAAGDRDLGVITSTSIFWPQSSGHFGLNRAYDVASALDDAAETALRDLYGRVAKSGALPGLSEKKK